MTDIRNDVNDALMFLTWRTKEDIYEEVGATTKVNKNKVDKEIKKLMHQGYVIQKGKKYKYDNADN